MEAGDGEITGRALSVARLLAAGSGGPVVAAVFPPGDAAALGGLPVEGVCEVSADGLTGYGLTGYAPAAWARALQQLIAAQDACAVVSAATDRGAEVLAHLGALTGLPVAANCVRVEAGAETGTWRLVRQRWAGSVLEDAILEAPVALLTVSADAVLPGDPVLPGDAAQPRVPVPEVRTFRAELGPSDLRVTATESAGHADGQSLGTARVVVGGGRGVGGPEGFAVLEELAGLLGGAVGVSRVVTSQGWRPHRQQVGQTGTKISPELYIACGISGAIQHMAGCQSARHVVAVNTDADAPIIARADYAVIGDLHEVLPALIAAIRAQAAS